MLADGKARLLWEWEENKHPSRHWPNATTGALLRILREHSCRILAYLLGAALALAALQAPSPTSARAGEMVTQGQNVELVAQIGGAAAAVAVQGRHVYLAVGTRVLVLDASDPAQPVVVGQSAPLPDVVRRIVAQDRYAYLAAGRAGLRVFDIGEPSAPRELAAVATARPAISIALYRNHAYVTEAGGGIRIFDLRNPRQPSEAGFYDASPSYVPPQIVGDHAYVGAGEMLRVPFKTRLPRS